MNKRVSKNDEKFFMQTGASFLEIIVVVALLAIMATFVVPAVGSWSGKAKVEADYHSILAQIEYLKTRVRMLNGTALLKCKNNSVLIYQLSTNYQTSNNSLDSNFTKNIVEDPLAKNANFNIVSGKTYLGTSSVLGASPICDGKDGLLIANGRSGVVGSASDIDIKISYKNDSVNYPAYWIHVNQETSYVQRYSWNNGAWREIN